MNSKTFVEHFGTGVAFDSISIAKKAFDTNGRQCSKFGIGDCLVLQVDGWIKDPADGNSKYIRVMLHAYDFDNFFSYNAIMKNIFRRLKEANVIDSAYIDEYKELYEGKREVLKKVMLTGDVTRADTLKEMLRKKMDDNIIEKNSQVISYISHNINKVNGKYEIDMSLIGHSILTQLDADVIAKNSDKDIIFYDENQNNFEFGREIIQGSEGDILSAISIAKKDGSESMSSMMADDNIYGKNAIEHLAVRGDVAIFSSVINKVVFEDLSYGEKANIFEKIDLIINNESIDKTIRDIASKSIDSYRDINNIDVNQFLGIDY
jgi:hypothetical protein